VPCATTLFPVAALVVLASVLIHGGAMMLDTGGRGTGDEGWVGEGGRGKGEGATPPPTGDRITLDEVKRLQAQGERVVLLDVRKEGAWRESDGMAQGALRLPPDNARARAAELALPRNDWLVAYCA
jgi:hypothetical protein